MEQATNDGMALGHKLSHYVIFSEPVNRAGGRMLYSTRTGRELVITEAVFDCLQANTFAELPDTIFDRLLGAQVIVPQEANELAEIVAENRDDTDSSQVLYEVIQPSAMCQLGCYYCGQQHTKDYLSIQAEDKIIDRIRLKAAAGSFKQLTIGWFGAEPLMGLRQMRRMTPRLQAVAVEFGLNYTARLVTNGLSLKEVVFEELATSLGVTQIEVTLDGTAEYHDKHRYTKEGGRSFDLILGNLIRILHRPDFSQFKCPITIRCNVDHANQAGVSDLIRLLVDKDLHRRIAGFYMVGVYSWGNDAHQKSLTKEEFAIREMAWKAEMLALGYPKLAITPPRKKQVCMTVSKTTDVYDSYGNIFDCTETAYVPIYADSAHKIGTLNADHTALDLPRSTLHNWHDTLLTDRFPCHTCPMLPVCGGACPKSWHEDMRACPPAKFSIKEKLLLKYVVIKRASGEHEKATELLRMYADKPWVRHLNQVETQITEHA